jgi:hypothetical protein
MIEGVKRRNKKVIQDNPRLLLEADVVGGRRGELGNPIGSLHTHNFAMECRY